MRAFLFSCLVSLAVAAPAAAQTKLEQLPPLVTGEAGLANAVADAAGVKRSIVLGGLDKVTARTFRFEAPVGATIQFKSLYIVARQCFARPPEETPESAVFLEVYGVPDREGLELQRYFTGWMFASSPGLNALEHPVYDVWVIGCRIDDPSGRLPAGITESEMTAKTEKLPPPPSIDEAQQGAAGGSD